MRLNRGGAALLLLFLAACRSGSDDAPEDASPGVDVLSYDVTLRLDPETFEARGRAHLTVARTDTVTVLVLGLDDALALGEVRVGGQRVGGRREGDRLFVPLATADTASVEIAYEGRIAEGVYRGTADGQTVVYSDAWPARAAGWLPAVHHPSDPAQLSLALEVPARYDVVASGVAGEVVEAGGWRRHRFVLEGDAPVYTFAFAVAERFAVVADSSRGVPIRHVLLDAADGRGLARTPAVLDVLADMLGPYPYAAYTTVQVPMRYAGMENAAAPFLRADLYADTSPGGVEEVNIHEAVHQWFGNDIVPADWRHLWLAEGFATYLTTVVQEALDGETAGRQARVRLTQLPAADAHRALVPDTYGDAEDMLTTTVYQKGASVLHLLRLTLGDAAFFRALRRLATAYADRPLSTAALQTLLEEESGRDLDAFFAYWVYGGTLPRLRTTWDAGRRRLNWQVEDDEGTLDGVPFELLVRQGAHDVYVRARDGSVTLSGTEEPTVYAAGVLMKVL